MRIPVIKICACLAVVAALFVFATPKAFATAEAPARTTRNVEVTDKRLPASAGSLKITGNLPVITGLTNIRFQTEINSLIENEYADKLAAARKDFARELNFSYEVKFDGNYTSVIMKTATTSLLTKEEVRTFVIGLPNRLLTLNDLLGINAVKIVNKVIEAEMARNPGTYNADFAGVTEKQSFYVDDGRVYVIFDKYAIGAAALGTPVFTVNISDISTFAITEGDYFQKEPYLKMIPLRTVASGLGFTVRWDISTRSVMISREGFQASVNLDKGNYIGGKGTSHSLESPPELRDDVTYLPISFFERILEACYTVNDRGGIIFSYYPAANTPAANTDSRVDQLRK